jgi:hypothetical protein
VLTFKKESLAVLVTNWLLMNLSAAE